MKEKIEEALLRDIRIIKSKLERQVILKNIDRNELYQVIFMLNAMINFYFKPKGE